MAKITEYATIEVIPNPDNSTTVANRRMEQMSKTPEEVQIWASDPTGMRNNKNLHPGIPCDMGD